MKKSYVVTGIVLGFLTAATLSGCATIVAGGGITHMNIATNPSGAKVTIKGLGNNENFEKSTPFSLDMSKNSDYEFQFAMQGYKSDTIVVRRTVSGWFWGNLFIGGIIGMAIDYGTGNMWDHSSNNLNIDLSKDIAQNPEQFEIQMPITLLKEDGQKVVKYIPVVFHKVHG